LGFWPCIKILDFLRSSNVLEYSVGFSGLHIHFDSNLKFQIPITDTTEDDFKKIKQLFEYLKII
jgi:hypothetical protein